MPESLDPPAPKGRSQFGRYWIGAAISSYGTAVTSVAMPVLVLGQLHASAMQAALVNAAQLVPYALFGFPAGAWVDRWRRRPVLVGASIGRALCLATVPVLFVLGRLTVPALAVALLAFGTCSVFGFAANQSLLPRIVPRSDLVRANARLDQTDATSMTLGPALGGVLVRWLGAPVSLVVDAASYLVEAALVAGLHVQETRPDRPAQRHLAAEIREGLSWTYRHPVLARLALSTHVWFLANGIAITTLQWLALRSFHMGATRYSLLLALLGVATLVGASAAPAAGRRFGAGRLVLVARTLYAVAWLVLAVGIVCGIGQWAVFVAQAAFGVAAGLENSNEMALWQSTTPDVLMGRVNASRRSVNRTAAAVGAVVGGLILRYTALETCVAIVGAIFACAAALVASTAVRTAKPAT